MKKGLIILFVFSLLINGYFLFKHFSQISLQNSHTSSNKNPPLIIIPDGEDFDLNKIQVWTWVKNIFAPLLKDFCSWGNSQMIDEVFKWFSQNDKKTFIHTLLPDWEALPILQSNKVYYIFDDCSDIIYKQDFYNECRIKQNEKKIFLRKNEPIFNIPWISIDFLSVQKAVKEGTCSLLSENKFFKQYIVYCESKEQYTIYLNKIYKDIWTSLCQK